MKSNAVFTSLEKFTWQQFVSKISNICGAQTPYLDFISGVIDTSSVFLKALTYAPLYPFALAFFTALFAVLYDEKLP